MIFQRKNDTVKLIEKLLKEISNKFPQNIKVIFDEKSENSFLKKDCNKEKYFISIGMKIDYKKNFNSLFVTKVIDIFHEYRHFIQYTKSPSFAVMFPSSSNKTLSPCFISVVHPFIFYLL